MKTGGGVAVAFSVTKEGKGAVSRVVAAGSVAAERTSTGGGVTVGGGVVPECPTSVGCIEVTSRVENKCLETGSGVLFASSVAKERLITNSRVEAAFCVTEQGERSMGAVLNADGVA